MCTSSVNLMMGRTHLPALFITEQEAVALQFEIYLEERKRHELVPTTSCPLGAWKQLGARCSTSVPGAVAWEDPGQTLSGTYPAHMQPGGTEYHHWSTAVNVHLLQTPCNGSKCSLHGEIVTSSCHS